MTLQVLKHLIYTEIKSDSGRPRNSPIKKKEDLGLERNSSAEREREEERERNGSIWKLCSERKIRRNCRESECMYVYE